MGKQDSGKAKTSKSTKVMRVVMMLLTARTSGGAEHEYEAAGMNGYIPKPVKPEQLAQTVVSAAGGTEA